MIQGLVVTIDLRVDAVREGATDHLAGFMRSQVGEEHVQAFVNIGKVLLIAAEDDFAGLGDVILGLSRHPSVSEVLAIVVGVEDDATPDRNLEVPVEIDIPIIWVSGPLAGC